jgi:hypothetical protein
LGKLVSPIICVGQFNHQNYLGTRCKPNSLSTLSHGVKTARPCSVPRTARARATAAPQTTRPVALTQRQDRRHLWRQKQATLRFRHNDRVKKGAPHHSILYPFPLPLSLSYNRDRERGYPKRDPSPRRKRAPRPLLIRGLKAVPSEGFNSRLRALGLRARYWSEVRRPALERVQRPPQATRAPRPLLIRGS